MCVFGRSLLQIAYLLEVIEVWLYLLKMALKTVHDHLR